MVEYLICGNTDLIYDEIFRFDILKSPNFHYFIENNSDLGL